MEFRWDQIQLREDGKIFLLYRHERIFIENLVRPGMHVLDVGGWGMLAKRIEQEGSVCTILDIFNEDQYYSERVKTLNFIEGDITDSAVVEPLGKFDLVTCFEMLEHCSDQEAALTNIFSVLNPGGYFVGTVPIPGFSHSENEPGIKFLTQEELTIKLVNTGFEVEIVEPTASVKKEDVACSLYFKALVPAV